MIDPAPPTVDELRDVSDRLTAAFRNFHVQMNGADGDLTEQFVEYLNHLGAAAPPNLPWRQAQVVALWHGCGMTHEQIAEALGISARTVERDKREALESIAIAVRR